MSDHYIGLNRGQSGFTATDFTTGTSTGNTDVEVRVADGANLTKDDVALILDAIRRKIAQDGLTTVLTNARV